MPFAPLTFDGKSFHKVGPVHLKEPIPIFTYILSKSFRFVILEPQNMNKILTVNYHCSFPFQTSSSLLGMLSSTVKCVQSHSTPQLKQYGQSSLKQIRLVWINHKNVIILTSDNKQFKFSV